MRSVTDTVDLIFKSLSSPLTSSCLGEHDRTRKVSMSQICYYNFILTIVFFRYETTRQTSPATSTSPSTIKTLEQTIAYLSSILIITTSPCSTTTAPAGKMTTMTPTATTNDDNNARLVNRPFSPTTKCVRLGGGDKNRPKRGCTPRLGPRYVFSFMSSFFIIK